MFHEHAFHRHWSFVVVNVFKFAKHFSQNNFSSGVARQAMLMTTSFVFTPFIYQGIINAWTMSKL